MDIETFTLMQWLLCGLAAISVGIAKTGVPGFGIIAVPIFAAAIGGLGSVGALLPLLICADCFAVFWYRRHAQWDKLFTLIPWVAVGVIVGAILIYAFSEFQIKVFGYDQKDFFDPLIGGIVLLMLIVHFLRKIFGEKLTPHQGLAVGFTGLSCGISTTLANAAGPIMTLYLAGKNLPKQQFMGTNAWFFLLLNVSKVPIYIALTMASEHINMISTDSFMLNIALAPLIFIGVFLGRKALHVIPQQVFDVLVIALAGLAAMKLLLNPILA